MERVEGVGGMCGPLQNNKQKTTNFFFFFGALMERGEGVMGKMCAPSASRGL